MLAIEEIMARAFVLAPKLLAVWRRVMGSHTDEQGGGALNFEWHAPSPLWILVGRWLWAIPGRRGLNVKSVRDSNCSAIQHALGTLTARFCANHLRFVTVAAPIRAARVGKRLSSTH